MSSPDAAARPRWSAIALLASLATNLFLAGLLVGDWLRPRDVGPPRSLPRAADAPPNGGTGETLIRGIVQRALAAIPADQRGAVERRLAGHRLEIQRASRELRAARERVRDAFLAEPIDRPALERAYAEQRERNLALQAATQNAVLEAMADLPLETRRAVVATLGLGARR
ncbi:MAG: periplasmic heavy metal sensor [Alphaproteobacteria bacterium]|nr:periplasmic heavy metal sensor [Alphaproteobacteria bacterium]